jgi:hypothetical protein
MAQPAVSPSPLVVTYDGTPPPPSWDLDYEESIPEPAMHSQVVDELAHLVLPAYASRTNRSWLVARNLGLHFFNKRPSVGLDPDVAIYEPRPPDAENLDRMRTWERGRAAPKMALEVFNPMHPSKVYGRRGVERYAASGTGELWEFDQLLAGPRENGGPYRLQVWVRDGLGRLVRVYAGEGPVRSPYLDAWLVVDEGGRRLRVSDDQVCTQLWLTGEETERAAKEAERAAKEAERAAKEAALDELARLRAELEALRRSVR